MPYRYELSLPSQYLDRMDAAVRVLPQIIGQQCQMSVDENEITYKVSDRLPDAKVAEIKDLVGKIGATFAEVA